MYFAKNTPHRVSFLSPWIQWGIFSAWRTFYQQEFGKWHQENIKKSEKLRHYWSRVVIRCNAYVVQCKLCIWTTYFHGDIHHIEKCARFGYSMNIPMQFDGMQRRSPSHNHIETCPYSTIKIIKSKKWSWNLTFHHIQQTQLQPRMKPLEEK